MDNIAILVLLLGIASIHCRPTKTDTHNCTNNFSERRANCLENFNSTYGNYSTNVAYPANDQLYYGCVFEYGGLASTTECQACGKNHVFSAYCQECTTSLDKEKRKCSSTSANVTSANVTQVYIDMCAKRGLTDADCKGKPLDRMIKDTSDPDKHNRFYFCQNGTDAEGDVAYKIVGCDTCRNSLVVNEICNMCDESRTSISDGTFNETDCPVPTTGEPDYCDHAHCMGKADGDYEIEEASHLFYSCSGGFCYNKVCQEDLYYSKACGPKGKCMTNYAKTSDDCEEVRKPIQVFAARLLRVAESCPENFCMNKNSGNYPHDTDARRYYQCIGFNFGNSPVSCRVEHCFKVFDATHGLCEDLQSPFYNATVAAAKNKARK